MREISIYTHSEGFERNIWLCLRYRIQKEVELYYEEVSDDNHEGNEALPGL